MFTQNQINEIREKLALSGYKDSDFRIVENIKGNEEVVIIQDGENVRIPVSKLISENPKNPDAEVAFQCLHITDITKGITVDEFHKLYEALNTGTPVILENTSVEYVYRDTIIGHALQGYPSGIRINIERNNFQSIITESGVTKQQRYVEIIELWINNLTDYIEVQVADVQHFSYPYDSSNDDNMYLNKTGGYTFPENALILDLDTINSSATIDKKTSNRISNKTEAVFLSLSFDYSTMTVIADDINSMYKNGITHKILSFHYFKDGNIEEIQLDIYDNGSKDYDEVLITKHTIPLNSGSSNDDGLVFLNAHESHSEEMFNKLKNAAQKHYPVFVYFEGITYNSYSVDIKEDYVRIVLKKIEVEPPAGNMVETESVNEHIITIYYSAETKYIERKDETYKCKTIIDIEDIVISPNDTQEGTIDDYRIQRIVDLINTRNYIFKCFFNSKVFYANTVDLSGDHDYIVFICEGLSSSRSRLILDIDRGANKYTWTQSTIPSISRIDSGRTILSKREGDEIYQNLINGGILVIGNQAYDYNLYVVAGKRTIVVSDKVIPNTSGVFVLGGYTITADSDIDGWIIEKNSTMSSSHSYSDWTNSYRFSYSYTGETEEIQLSSEEYSNLRNNIRNMKIPFILNVFTDESDYSLSSSWAKNYTDNSLDIFFEDADNFYTVHGEYFTDDGILQIECISKSYTFKYSIKSMLDDEFGWRDGTFTLNNKEIEQLKLRIINNGRIDIEEYEEAFISSCRSMYNKSTNTINLYFISSDGACIYKLYMPLNGIQGTSITRIELI